VEGCCDRQRIGQIVRILLDNALRHTPEGAPVRLGVNAANGTARVTVADEGPKLRGRGVDRAVVRQAFERFYTGDAVGGSGLGLAIARELAGRMDGGIRLDAGERETVFTVELPAAGPAGEEPVSEPVLEPATRLL
ncbi:MAG: ATP-binding protein, partial [Actinomycetota bacterium]|nr:ATP-binding protein [Actinomycetota bacterium]